jgi:hypothetical protein
MILVTPQFDRGPHHPHWMPRFVGVFLRACQYSYAHHLRATQIPAAGQELVLVFGFVGLFANPFLVLISYFLPR